MSESINWVTVKVPESDREKAKDYRPDGSTFGDCLVAGAERLNDHLASDTAGYLEPQLREDTARKIVAEIRDQLGIEGDADVAELVAELADDGSDDIEHVAELVERIPERTADEVEGRMR